MTSGTNELIALRKLERMVRRTFHGLDSVRAAEMATAFRGSGGPVFVTNARRRDILRTLDQLEAMRR